MGLRKVEMSFSRDELQILTNCVTFSLDKNYGDSSYKDKFDLYLKLCEQLDYFTAQDMEMERYIA